MHVCSCEVKHALGLNMHYCKSAQLGVQFLSLLEREVSLSLDLLCLGFCLSQLLLQNTDLIEKPQFYSLSKKPAHLITITCSDHRAYGGR